MKKNYTILLADSKTYQICRLAINAMHLNAFSRFSNQWPLTFGVSSNKGKFSVGLYPLQQVRLP